MSLSIEEERKINQFKLEILRTKSHPVSQRRPDLIAQLAAELSSSNNPC